MIDNPNLKTRYPLDLVKYLDAKIDEHLTLKKHFNGISNKLKEVNAKLSEIRYSQIEIKKAPKSDKNG